MASAFTRLAGQRFLLPATFLLLFYVRVVEAYDYQCYTYADDYPGNAANRFWILDWLDRGLCIRRIQDNAGCYTVLQGVLNNLNQLRQAEYSGAAGVLALLPTIGALLGAPAPEIWKTMCLYPIGGILTIFLSFGGAIMPVNVSDYEEVMTKKESTTGSVVSFRQEASGSVEHAAASVDQKLRRLFNRIKARVVDRHAANISPQRTWVPWGVLWMCLLLFMAQFGMAIVEQGSVIPWWCGSTWWMHMWYFLVTLTSAIENIAQLPFVRQHRFFISNVPYDIEVSHGQEVMPTLRDGEARRSRHVSHFDPAPSSGDDEIHLSKAEQDRMSRQAPQVSREQAAQTSKDDVETILRQLETLRTARVINRGSSVKTVPRCSVTVLVSVVGIGNKYKQHFLQIFSKAASITVFVCGTAIFAAVVLLALEAAVMILTLLLAGGIIGRAMASLMVSALCDDEPLIHVIVPEEHEYKVVSSLLSKDAFQGADVQIEVRGNIFVRQQRVAKRKWGRWYVHFWGVTAEPFDLLRVAVNPPDHHHDPMAPGPNYPFGPANPSIGPGGPDDDPSGPRQPQSWKGTYQQLPRIPYHAHHPSKHLDLAPPAKLVASPYGGSSPIPHRSRSPRSPLLDWQEEARRSSEPTNLSNQDYRVEQRYDENTFVR